jgi:predicted SprT family Zn-dependent metalloprotease
MLNKELQSLKNKIHDEIRTMNEIIENEFSHDYHNSINLTINYNLTSTRKLGTCRYLHTESKGNNYLFEISLNEDLLLRYKELYIKEVFRHEYAHVMTDVIYDFETKPHGKEWKFIATLFRTEPKASTNLFKIDKSKGRQRRWIHKCGCDDGINLSTTIHNKILKGHGYSCKRCSCKISSVFREV